MEDNNEYVVTECDGGAEENGEPKCAGWEPMEPDYACQEAVTVFLRLILFYDSRLHG